MSLVLAVFCVFHCFAAEMGNSTMEEPASPNLTVLKPWDPPDTGDNFSSRVKLSCDKHRGRISYGAFCENNTVVALPGFWGQLQNGQIKMTKCPVLEYCCTGSGSCHSYNSCNKGRTGKFCFQCEANKTEVAFSADCVRSGSCSAFSFSFVYFLAVALYLSFLLLHKTVKELFVAAVKRTKALLAGLKGNKHDTENDFAQVEMVDALNLMSSVETKISQHQKVRQSQEKSKVIQNYHLDLAVKEKVEISLASTQENSSNTSVFLQLLFYFYQDASLFHIQLPQKSAQNFSLLQNILSFSPELLLVLENALHICISASSSTLAAFWKIIFKISFGFCVMSGLFLVYFLLKMLSPFISFQSKETVKGKLCEAFIVTLLLSFQKTVENFLILSTKYCHVWSEVGYYGAPEQGPICIFTVFFVNMVIFFSVIPLFYILGRGPFLIKQKKISVSFFVVSCFFPLPAGLVYFMWNIAKSASKCQAIQSLKHTLWLCGTVLVSLVLGFLVLPFSFLLVFREDSTVNEDSMEGQPEGYPLKLWVLTTLGFVAFWVGFPTLIFLLTKCLTHCVRKLQRCSKCCRGHETPESVTINTGHTETDKYSESEEVIMSCLIKQYRQLSICGLTLSWIGFYKLYRLSLVYVKIYVTDSLVRSFTMMFLLLLSTLVKMAVKPYNTKQLNKLSMFLDVLTIFIAFINILKATILWYGTLGQVEKFESFLNWLESALLNYLPVFLCFSWMLVKGIKMLVQKCKKFKCSK